MKRKTFEESNDNGYILIIYSELWKKNRSFQLCQFQDDDAETIREAFKLFDRDQDGYITCKELKKVNFVNVKITFHMANINKMTIIECSNHIMPCTSNTNQVTTMLGQPLSAEEVGAFT